MTRKKIAILVSSAVVLAVLGAGIAQLNTHPFQGEATFVTEVNSVRANLPALRDDPALSTIAGYKCNDMVAGNYFSHTDPEGKYVWERYAAQLGPYKAVGENLAKGYKSATETVQKWMLSESHKKNILDARFHRVGHYTCKTGSTYMTVQLFAD